MTRATRVGAGVGAVGYVGSLFLVWCVTPSGVGLFGRPRSPVDIEQFGVDYPIEGWCGAAVLAACATLTLAGRLERLAAVGAAVVAAATTVRLVVGDHEASPVGRVWLHGTWGAAVAAAAAWLVVGCSLAAARRAPASPAS